MKIQKSSSVQFGDTFLLVGGYGDVGNLDTIIEFDEAGDRWIVRNETLQTARSDHAAILMPDSNGICGS